MILPSQQESTFVYFYANNRTPFSMSISKYTLPIDFKRQIQQQWRINTSRYRMFNFKGIELTFQDILFQKNGVIKAYITFQGREIDSKFNYYEYDVPEIFKYFNYSQKQLTVKADQQFEFEMKSLGFDNLNEFPNVKLSLIEQIVKMIELILFQRDQIEQKRLKQFLQIIPDLNSYFNLFIQKQNDTNFQDQENDIDENLEFQNENLQLAKQAIQFLMEIQQLSENPTWQELKRDYLIKMLNYTAYLGQPLPQILGALQLVETELTLKVDKTLIKFLKTSKLYYHSKQNLYNLQEKELICKLLDILSQEITDPDVQKQLEEQLQSVQVRNLYANLKQLKLKQYLQYFNKLYHSHEKIPHTDQVTLIYRISSNGILAPELIKYIRIKKVRRYKDDNSFVIHLNVNSQLIEDFANNPGLRDLNNQCRISSLLSKETRVENCKTLDSLRFKQKIRQIQSQLQEELIFDAVTTIHRHHQNIVKDLHLIFQYGVVISTMNQFQNYFRTNIDSESYISRVYELLSQMNQFVNRHFQNESIIIETPDFHQNLTNYNNSETATVLTKKTKILQNRNIRKMLYYMIQKQVVFPEFINFLQIVDKAKRHLLQLNKGTELVNLIENNRKIQYFMNQCLNGEEALFNQIKVTDFEKLPSKKEVDTNSYESHEQSSIINILQILFDQKEIHKDSLKHVFQQSAVQCLIYEMKQIYTQIPHQKKQLQQAYQILYDLNYWTQNIQQEEHQYSEPNSQQTLEQQQQQYIILYYIILYYIILSYSRLNKYKFNEYVSCIFTALQQL